MRIGINIDGQFINMTGIQQSVDSLLNGLYGLDSPNDIYAFTSEWNVREAIDEAAAKNPGDFAWRNSHGATVDGPSGRPMTLVTPKLQSSHAWLSQRIRGWERHLLSRLPGDLNDRVRRYDVLHFPDPHDMRFVSYRSRHSVATIYDLTTRLSPGTFPKWTIALWNRYYSWARDRCSAVVAISESTKRDAIEHLKIPEERIFVTPLAGRVSTRRVEDNAERRAVLSKWKLESQPFVLYAGTLEPRKNLDRLVRAFAQMRRENPSLEHKLVLAGGNWERLDLELRLLACEHGLGGRVLTTGYVTNDELNALMSACDAFAYVSLYEGFGMPPLEAMTCGAPVVVSNTSSLPEVVGEAGLLVSPKDETAIAQALSVLLTDRAENARRRKLSLARAAQFSWERTAKLTMHAYEAAGA